MNKFYAYEVSEKVADLYIFGDIVEPIEKAIEDMMGVDTGAESSVSIIKDIKNLDVDEIIVHINSYGGSVAQGLAIYNSLISHNAKITTVVDGIAASIASVIFMAGDKRIMNPSSLLMIHNAWIGGCNGNAEELRKHADSLDTITQTIKNTYLNKTNISEEKLSEMMNAETWITPDEAMEMAFATFVNSKSNTEKAAADGKQSLFNLVTTKPKKIDNNLLKIFKAL